MGKRALQGQKKIGTHVFRIVEIKFRCGPLEYVRILHIRTKKISVVIVVEMGPITNSSNRAELALPHKHLKRVRTHA